MATTDTPNDDRQTAIAQMDEDRYQAWLTNQFAREDAALERMETVGADVDDRHRAAAADWRDRYRDDLD